MTKAKKELESKKESTEITKVEVPVVVESKVLTVDEIVYQVEQVDLLYKKVMRENQHYGIIPGCGDKPTLLKGGAEKILLLFRLAAKVDSETVNNYDNGHREYIHVIGLYHRITGEFLGQGTGSCSTLESKYRYRSGGAECPDCGKAAIIKGKAEYGGGWLCWKKKGGCGAKFEDSDSRIKSDTERVENPEALISAVLSATAVSDIFTQDIEDMKFDTKPPKEKKEKKEEKAPPKNVTPDSAEWTIEQEETYQDIIASCKIIGIDGVTLRAQYQIKSFKSCTLKRLKEILGHLKTEIDGAK